MELYKEKYKKLIRDYLIGYKPSYVEFLKKRYKGYKYICGFSVGNMGRGVLELADAMGRKIDFYCDNDLQKTGKKDPYKGMELYWKDNHILSVNGSDYFVG